MKALVTKRDGTEIVVECDGWMLSSSGSLTLYTWEGKVSITPRHRKAKMSFAPEQWAEVKKHSTTEESS